MSEGTAVSPTVFLLAHLFQASKHPSAGLEVGVQYIDTSVSVFPRTHKSHPSVSPITSWLLLHAHNVQHKPVRIQACTIVPNPSSSFPGRNLTSPRRRLPFLTRPSSRYFPRILLLRLFPHPASLFLLRLIWYLLMAQHIPPPSDRTPHSSPLIIKLAHIPPCILNLHPRSQLLPLRLIKITLLRGPSRIRSRSQYLQLFLPHQIMTLLSQGRWSGARVSQPLMPLRCDFEVAVVSCGRILYDATHASGVDGVFKFPVGISLEVETYRGDDVLGLEVEMIELAEERTNEESFPPWELQGFPSIPGFTD